MKTYRLHEKAWSCKPAWKIVNSSWTLCHEIVDARDGHRCILCLRERDLQLDHMISRNYKSVFLDTDNLNWLCSRCHSAKSFNPTGTESKRVDEITRQRLGAAAYEELLRKAKINCPQWRTLAWQESCHDQLVEELEMVKAIADLKGWRQ